MSEIQPMDDAYIDSIIKAADAYNPNLSKTQGIQLRELIKLMRDRFEQQLANVSGGSAAAEPVQTYAAMIAKGIPNDMKTYEVATDEKRNLTNSIYQWWPDGKLFYIESVLDSQATPNPDPTPEPEPNEPVEVRVYGTTSNVTKYESTDLLSAVDYLNTNGITEDTTLEILSSSTIPLTNQIQLDVNNNNGAYNLTLEAAQDKAVVLDGQNLIPTVLLVSMNNCTINRLTLANGDPVANNGCLVRADSTRNVSLIDINYKRGYCAVRATENVYDMLIDGGTVAEMYDGSFRIGNGLSTGIDGLYDTQNVILRNVSFLNTLNGGLISGTDKVNSPYFLLKACNGVLVEGLIYNQQIQSSIGTIEESHNVVFNNVVANETTSNGIQLMNNKGVLISNYFFKPIPDLSNGATGIYGDNTGQIKIYQCTLLIGRDDDSSLTLENTYQVEMEGNIFQSTPYDGAGAGLAFKTADGYVATLANDLISEKSNVFIAQDDWSVYLSVQFLSDINNGEYTKIFKNGDYIPSVWQSTYNRGQNSVYVNDFALLSFTDGLHLSETSVGKNIVLTQIGNVTNDASGAPRVFSTDAGAFDN